MPVVPTLDIETYLDFKAMTHYLKAVSSAAPHLVRVFSIGKSRAGRPLLVAEVTNRNLREGRQKPGLWIDGGHQGWHLLGSTACLELLRFLVAGHGRDEFLTDLVDHTVFYIAPRLAPDEMEQCLQTGALLPQETQAESTLSLEGRQFRIQSPLGSWKPFKRDNRVLVPRNPEDRKGPFYDLYRQLDETRLDNIGPCDFPSEHGGIHSAQPLQLPSTRAIFEFMRSYNNVFGVISTSGPGDRVQLVSNKGESKLINNLGHRLSELAGLPFSPVQAAREKSGQFLSWASEGLGLLAADCQMWSLRAAAGLKENELENPFSADETELLHLMRFCEKEFPENSFQDWAEAQEPVLGKGESGGWDWSKTWLNPPSGPYLSRELKKLSRLALGLASASPRLSVERLEETILGWAEDKEPLRQITVSVQNTGYMPTCPVESGKDLAGLVSINLGQNSLLMGKATQTLQEMRGTGLANTSDGLPLKSEIIPLPQQRCSEYVYLIKGSGDVEVVLSHPLAGTEKVVSKMPQGARAPSFEGQALRSAPEAPIANDDPFEEAFPSFEELYQEPSPPEPSPPVQRVQVSSPVTPPPVQRPAEYPLSGEFNIPDPLLQNAPAAKPVKFGSLDPTGPPETKSSPFPSQKPSKGRVFGSPPQKPTGGLPASLGGSVAGGANKPSEGEFSPLPLVKSNENQSSAFEPLIPIKNTDPGPPSDLFGSETIEGIDPIVSHSDPSLSDQASLPPARLSRMSAPQLLRRQRGGQGPKEPFKRS